MPEQRKPPPKAVHDALANLPDDLWTIFERTPDYVRSFTVVDILGIPTRAERTQYVEDATLQALNRHEYEESHSKRWKDGRVVARIPLNVMFGQSEIAKKLGEGDRDHLKWWVNHEANRPFRTFRGKV